jgi:hypothetical protein
LQEGNEKKLEQMRATVDEKLQSTLRGPWWQGYENPEANTLIARAQATLAKVPFPLEPEASLSFKE